jgi:2-keto-4-pentenoate hydratase/2-oxohepta-3-ene-1,7-dioic acid hydratase in catechol pathway
MRYCRFLSEEGPRFGVIEEQEGEPWVTEMSGSPWQSEEPAILALPPIRLGEVKLLPPVAPSKIVCVGRNYRDHAKELGNDVPTEPLLFFKPPSSLLAPGAPILLPAISSRVDFEGELAIIIAKQAHKLRRGDDLQPYIHGYTLANDVTARDLQKKEGQWTRAKGFDTFCPVGPLVHTGIELSALAAGLTIETRLNGEMRQHGSSADFIFALPELLEYITAAMTLEPGDLLLTGTPAGVGPLAPGDLVEVTAPGLGILANPVETGAA